MAELPKLGRYELRSVLGTGAMGVVYEGFDPLLHRRVAVKTILKSVALDAQTQRDYAARFVREAQAVGRLNHPNIVQVHDFGFEKDVSYLVMEFIQGRELRAYFDAREKFSSSEAVRVMGELLDALEFAHQAGVIHRDVKPANVMLDMQLRVKLADFGVARVQDSDRSAAGTMVGTPAFMSPEQISGGKIDRRTDVFSAGVVLYQLLTGQQPFKGEGAWTVAKQIMQDDPTPPSALVTNISPAYDALIDKALAKNPAERFASAREFALALRSTIAGGAPAAAIVPPKPRPKLETRASEAEVEFWRAIQNSSDAAEISFYLERFPDGTYAPLARHKIAKLREGAAPDPQATVRIPADEGPANEAKAKRELEQETAHEPLPSPAADRKTSHALPVIAAAVAIAAAIGAYWFLGRTPAPVAQVPVAPKVEAPAPAAAPPKAELSVADVEKIRKETEERIRREYADKSAAEQAAAAKAAGDKAVQEKQTAMKAAAEKVVAERIAAAERAAAERAAAAEKAARAAAEKTAEEKAAVTKAAEERAAAARGAEAKASTAKAAEPAKALPASVAVPPRDGVLPGRYAFHLTAGSGFNMYCDQIYVQEEIDVPAGNSQIISGRNFSDVQFRSAQDGSVAATLRGTATRWGNGDATLTGRATAAGYAGAYEWRSGIINCTGQWTLVRK
jgi:serine/threonine-protein kinase